MRVERLRSWQRDACFGLLAIALPLALWWIVKPPPQPPPFHYLDGADRVSQRVVDDINDLKTRSVHLVVEAYEIRGTPKEVRHRAEDRRNLRADWREPRRHELTDRDDLTVSYQPGRVSRGPAHLSPSLFQLTTDRDPAWTTVLICVPKSGPRKPSFLGWKIP